MNSTVAKSYHTSPLFAAVEILWFNGIVVVVSAGNNGTSTIYPTANDPFVSVGGAHPANRLDTTYFRMLGASLSAPMVSGAVAILLQDEPNLTPDQVRYRLMATANQSWAGYNAASVGAGYLNIYNVVYSTTTQSANTGSAPSQLLYRGNNPIAWSSVGWNSVGWNGVGWNSIGWAPH